MNTSQIELAVASLFDYRRNLIIPNVSWGFFSNFEVDLLIIRPSLWAIEIEIKTSAVDIRRDREKHRHRVLQVDRKIFTPEIARVLFPTEEKIQRKFFAVPKGLAEDPNIPADVGIIAVAEQVYGHRASILRPAPINPHAVKLRPADERKLLRLAHMRVWTLKQKLEAERRPKAERPE